MHLKANRASRLYRCDNSYQLSCNSCSCLIGARGLRKPSCKLLLLNSHQLITFYSGSKPYLQILHCVHIELIFRLLILYIGLFFVFSKLQSIKCEACSPGTFANISALTQCYECPKGTFVKYRAYGFFKT
jgi:hypothetical protein